MPFGSVVVRVAVTAAVALSTGALIAAVTFPSEPIGSGEGENVALAADGPTFRCAVMIDDGAVVGSAPPPPPPEDELLLPPPPQPAASATAIPTRTTTWTNRGVALRELTGTSRGIDGADFMATRTPARRGSP
jgi:hypothetical protein